MSVILASIKLMNELLEFFMHQGLRTKKLTALSVKNCVNCGRTSVFNSFVPLRAVRSAEA